MLVLHDEIADYAVNFAESRVPMYNGAACPDGLGNPSSVTQAACASASCPTSGGVLSNTARTVIVDALTVHHQHHQRAKSSSVPDQAAASFPCLQV